MDTRAVKKSVTDPKTGKKGEVEEQEFLRVRVHLVETTAVRTRAKRTTAKPAEQTPANGTTTEQTPDANPLDDVQGTPQVDGASTDKVPAEVAG